MVYPALLPTIRADAHTPAASSRLNWRPRRFKWTRPFPLKTKSGFCACAVTFQLASTIKLTFTLLRNVSLKLYFTVQTLSTSVYILLYFRAVIKIPDVCIPWVFFMYTTVCTCYISVDNTPLFCHIKTPVLRWDIPVVWSKLQYGRYAVKTQQ